MAISSVLGSSALLPAGLGFRNKIINGGMDIWQRGTSGSVGGTVSYTADRWQSVTYAGGTMNWSQVTSPVTPIGSRYSLRVQRPSAATSLATMNIGYSCETADSLSFAGKQVVLSFYARCGANFSASSSLLTVQVPTGTGTDQSVYGTGFTGSTNIINTTATLTTSWQKFQFVGTAGSSISQIGIVMYYTPVGTAGAADHFEITGVQLEQNYQPTPFEQRPIGTELALCQRYYQLVGAGVSKVIAMGTAYSTSAWYAPYFNKVSMRTAPTLVVANGTNYWIIFGNNNNFGFTTLKMDEASTETVRFFADSGLSINQGSGFWLQTNNGSSSVALSAEL